jgi:TolB-like protein/predicted Ser/Thr protein kinase
MPEFPESIGPYTVLAKVGEGSMGVVYKAHDKRLDRVVALKMIRELQSDPGKRRRFRQEARVAAQVSHPNACRLYDLVEDHDSLFLVMEFIEGESLAERMKRGALPPQEAAQIVLGMLSALEAFHQAGIVHRDVKPSNVITSAQGTKLLDFGIAKQIPLQSLDSAATAIPDATMPGVFLGTPRYASPEQFEEGSVDARSDIFSVGTIFFEMLVGLPPFPGQTFAEIAHHVLSGSPPALTGSPAISAMGRIVHTALAREPQDRYPTAEAMAADIRAALAIDGPGTRATARPVQRLMVLPFRILRPSQEIQFLAFSLPEAIAVSLAGLNDLVVRSSLVAAQYSSDSPDLKRIAREAQVDVVLTGALLHVGEQLRITTQLVEAPGGTVLWSNSSQATIHQLLQLHDDLVRRVVESVLPSLNIHERQALQQDRPASATVYEQYLRGNELSRNWQSLPAAIEHYERCVQMDADYAPAWARLGRSRWLFDKYSLGSTEGLRAADEAFQVALRLNPDLALAHNLYTALQVDQGRALDALRRLLDRLKHRRNDPDLFAGLAHVCRYCGLLQPALAAHEEARRLDPQIPTSVNNTYFLLGDYQQALETGAADFGYTSAISLPALGRTSEAAALLRERERTDPPRLGKLYLTSLRALLEGNRAESLAASDELLDATFRDPEGMFYLARQLGYLKEEVKALTMLRRSIDHGFFCYASMIRDPWLDSLRGSTEFTELLRKAQGLHRQAVDSFVGLGGNSLLGMHAEGY